MSDATISAAGRYIQKARQTVEKIAETQLAQIEKAAGYMAEAIRNDGLVRVFGTGHGSLPSLEAFPRSGSIIGFQSIAELPITLLHHVGGDMGIEQFRFLQRQEGYGTAILNSHRPQPGDVLLLFSHSGMNSPVLDMALEAKRRGMPVVAVTSLEHSLAVKPRHSSGKRLLEIADVVIDTGAPLGDASIEIEGLAHKVGPVSTVATMTIMNALVVQTAARLVELGYQPHVEVNMNVPSETSIRAHNDEGYADYRKRVIR
jgi:uncharacterized phosphosugar-binding protein